MTGVTYTPVTDLPTDRPTTYYAYRLTHPHSEWKTIKTLIDDYSQNYLVAFHSPDDQEKGCLHEHFHMIFPGVDAGFADRMKKQMSSVFGCKGNDFHAGRYRNNPIIEAVGYMKHDANVRFEYVGSTEWERLIKEAPAFVKKSDMPVKAEKRERESDPVLTYSNLLFQAEKHRKKHGIKCTKLATTLEHMTRTTDWLPTKQMMTQGLDPLHHRLFEYRASGRVGPTPDWWTPRSI